jgi:hypothetical protein
VVRLAGSEESWEVFTSFSWFSLHDPERMGAAWEEENCFQYKTQKGKNIYVLHAIFHIVLYQ